MLFASPVLAQNAAHGGGSSWSEFLLSWSPLILVGVLWFFLMRSRMGPGGTDHHMEQMAKRMESMEEQMKSMAESLRVIAKHASRD